MVKAKVELIIDPEDLKLPLLPGNKGLPFVGETFEFLRDRTSFYTNRAAKYGNMYRTQLLRSEIAWIIEPDIIKQLLMKDTVWLSQGHFQSVQDLLGKHSLIVETGKAHKMHRQLILDNALGHGKTPSYYGVVTKYASEQVNEWMSSKAGQVVHAHDGMKRFTMRVSMKIVVGFSPSDEENNLMIDLVNGISKGVVSIPNPFGLGAYGKAMKARTQLLEIIDRHFAKLRERLESEGNDALKHHENGTSFVPVLAAMLQSVDPETGEPAFTREMLNDQALVFTFAGFDTTSSTLSSTLLLIGYNKACGRDIMARLREEQRQVIEKHGEKFTPEAAQDMKLLEACIKETHRVLPTVGGGMRKVLKDLKITTASGDQYRLPKSSRLVFNLAGIASYDDGKLGTRLTRQDWKLDVLEQFNPDIWFDDSVEKPTLLPFSYGMRKCVGYRLSELELVLFMATLLREGTWELRDGIDVLKSERTPFPVPHDNLPVIFTKDPIVT